MEKEEKIFVSELLEEVENQEKEKNEKEEKKNEDSEIFEKLAQIRGISKEEMKNEILWALEKAETEFVSLKESVLHTYSPLLDSQRLRNAPESFEELRGSYPLRREFQAFRVLNVPEKERKILEQLGFQVG